jgi:hypothetical protein
MTMMGLAKLLGAVENCQSPSSRATATGSSARDQQDMNHLGTDRIALRFQKLPECDLLEG